MICAGGTRDACKGDSGGPLTCAAGTEAEGTFQHYLCGIVSWGQDCENRKTSQFPGLYMDVRKYNEWVTRQMGKVNAPYPCDTCRHILNTSPSLLLQLWRFLERSCCRLLMCHSEQSGKKHMTVQIWFSPMDQHSILIASLNSFSVVLLIFSKVSHVEWPQILVTCASLN